jgi:putative redox protein
MKANVVWKANMSFDGASESGHVVQLDTSISAGGLDAAARPMELIALGLAGCTGMDVISILQKKQQVVTGFEVKVDAAKAQEHPKVFTNAVLSYIVDGVNIDEAAVVRAIELSVTKYCPAQAMLSKAFPIHCRYEIYEKGTLKIMGEWKPVP